LEGAEGDVCGDEEGGCWAGGEDGVPEVFDEGCHDGRVRGGRWKRKCLIWVIGDGRSDGAVEGREMR